MYISNFEIINELTHQGLAILTGDPTGTNINQQKVDAAILYASNIIDVYCYARYEVPLSPVPMIILDIATSLAIYYLYVFEKRDDLITAVIIYRKLDAFKMLRDIAEGRLHIETTEKGSKYKFSSDKKLINE